MKKALVYFFLILLLLSACSRTQEETQVLTNTPVLPTGTIGPSPTPRQVFQDDPTATPRPSPTNTEQPDEPVEIPDMTEVTLHLVTRLEENQQYLQVSLDGWPDTLLENYDVRVGLEVFHCEKLFPEVYPDRMYCWGLAPRAGSAVVLQVFLEGVADSILDVPFRVPYIVRETEEN
jgi:hypothetical protein